jgi:hypothetical protein
MGKTGLLLGGLKILTSSLSLGVPDGKHMPPLRRSEDRDEVKLTSSLSLGVPVPRSTQCM